MNVTWPFLCNMTVAARVDKRGAGACELQFVK